MSIQLAGPNTALVTARCAIGERHFTDFLSFIRTADGWRIQLDALNLMQAQSRVLDLPDTHIDARHPKYIALRPIPGAAVSSSGDT